MSRTKAAEIIHRREPMNQSGRALALHRALADRQRAAQPDQGQQHLVFGDLGVDDGQPEFHGTQVGVSRHARAGEPLCGKCQDWMQVVVNAGFARSLNNEEG